MHDCRISGIYLNCLIRVWERERADTPALSSVARRSDIPVRTYLSDLES
jgi:hypothetical protein